ncbi:MAG: uncharacterized protein JWM25_259, partial [Thermoleophilia bacterium]|nr:uncharacterized protein [Thermoleophilia bacterium]
VDLSGRGAPRGPGIRAAFVPTPQVASVQQGNSAEPLVLHVAEGDCLEVTLRNQRERPEEGGPIPRVSFHVSELQRTTSSSGVNIGFSPEQTVGAGQTRTYRMYAESERIEGALITDMGRPTHPIEGLYGMVVVSPRGSAFRDPVSGMPKSIGAQVIVDPPGAPSYRDMALILFDNDDKIGLNEMPYPVDVSGKPSINYSIAGARRDTPDLLRSGPNGPGTPLLQANIGDPIRVHIAIAGGSEQDHTFSLGGSTWLDDPFLAGSNRVSSIGLAPWEVRDIHAVAGAESGPGVEHWGDLRRPFTEAGIWGLLRVHGTCSTTFIQIPGSSCPEATPEP